MGLNSTNNNSCITGINNTTTYVSDICNVTLKSLVTSFSTHLKCLVMPKIIGHLPNFPVNVAQLNLPDTIQLADPKFYQPSEIDILIGVDLFFNIISAHQMRLGTGMPILHDSKLGWIVAGPLDGCNYIKPNKISNRVHCNFTKQIRDDLARFWMLEEIQSSNVPVSAEHEFCENHFLENTSRLPNGRFSVLMTMLEDPHKVLGDSYIII